MQAKLSFSLWQTELERILLQGWCIVPADAGFDSDDLEPHWADGTSPLECAQWLERKYDLVRRDF